MGQQNIRIRTRFSRSSQQSSFPLNKALGLVLEKQGTLLHTGNPMSTGEPSESSESAVDRPPKMHVLGYEPLLKLFETHWELVSTGECFGVADPFEALSSVLEEHSQKPTIDFAFEGGFLGFCAYDLKNNLEETGLYTTFPQSSPKLYFVLYAHLEVFCLKTRRLLGVEQSVEFNPNRKDERKPQPAFDWRKQPNLFVPPLVSEAPDYEGLVGLVKERIRSGDAYQVNLSRKVTGQMERPIEAVCRSLLLQNPTNHQGIINTSFGTLVSTSPESFFEYRQGFVSATPIKGTAPRSGDERKDEAIKEKLKRSPKNLAELAMITDLFRNDFASLPKTTNIEVQSFPILTSYQNVHHLSSRVACKTDSNMVDVLKKLFPSGSVTGCPKVKACQLIEALESESRGVYTGCMGYFSFNQSCAFNVLIRTAFLRERRFEYRVGGGITILSNPREEFLETTYKEQTLKNCLY